MDTLTFDTRNRPAQPSARTTATRLTAEQRTVARQAHEAGETLLEIEVVAGVQSETPAAQLYQAALALSEAGRVLAAMPELDDLTHETIALWAIIATTMARDAVVALLQQIPGLAETRVHTYELDGGTGIVAAPAAHDSEKTARISIERLDMLMNLVGELVTDRTHLSQPAAAIEERAHALENIGALNELTAHLGWVVGQLQEEVMRARMLPIASLFDKFPRLVRDVARAAVKDVELQIVGASTELDRSIIEDLHDPLIHLVRNAIDHGIEPPPERTAVPMMLVSLGANIFAVPCASVIDTWSLNERIASTAMGGSRIEWHGTVLPLIELRQVFGHPPIAEEPRSAKAAIVTVGWGKLRAGLVVDRIIGQQEVVSKHSARSAVSCQASRAARRSAMVASR
jgi:chemotaxis protein histidine kinase CheA